MSALSNVIKEMTTSVPLGVGESFESGSQYLGHYASISVIAFSDMDLSLTYYFSFNGVDFDHAENWVIPAGVSTVKTVFIVGKYVKMGLVNLSDSPATVLRVGSYGCVISGTVNVASPDGGDTTTPTPVEVVDLQTNAYGSLEVGAYTPFAQYNLELCKPGDLANGSYKSKYRDVRTYTSLPEFKSLIDNPVYGGGAFISQVNHTGPEESTSVCYGRPMQVRQGQGLRASFAASFIQGVKEVTGEGTTKMLVGAGFWSGPNTTFPNTLVTCVGFGYYSGTVGVPPTADDFGVIMLNQGANTSNRTIFVKRSSWNMDKADGSGTLPLISNWENLHSFKVESQADTGAGLFFSIISPTTGKYVNVHCMIKSGETNVKSIEPSAFGMIQWMQKPELVEQVFNNPYDRLTLKSFSIGSIGEQAQSSTYHNITSILNASFQDPVLMIVARVSDILTGDRMWGGDIRLVKLTVAGIGFGNQDGPSLRIYKNIPTTAASYVAPTLLADRIALELATGTPTLLPQDDNTNLIDVIFFNSRNSTPDHIDLSKLNIYLNREDTLTIVAQASNADGSNKNVCLSTVWAETVS